ncbi:MAG: hypothetical protein HY063_04400 [Bacteroidetes bacterium]|nr:hypothetical protein [Bacteroidota bacterium]
MTQEQDKLSKGWKIWTISGIVIFVAAIAYSAYRTFGQDSVTSGDYSQLTMMGVLFIVMLVTLRPVFKKW